MAAVHTAQNESRASALVAPGQRIRSDDAGWLRWYFSDPLVAGISQSSGGLFGLQLEKARIFSLGMILCRRCAGTGSCPREKKPYGKALLQYCAAELRRRNRELPKAKHLRLVDSVETALGWRAVDVHNVVAPEEIAAELPESLTKFCQRCDGTGWQARRWPQGGPQTARPTGNSKPLGARELSAGFDEWSLASYGMLSRKLGRVRAESASARSALQLYFGPGGGNTGVLWSQTGAGVEFYRGLDNPLRLTPDALFHNEAAADRQNPKPWRTHALSSIARQTDELWGHSCEVWNRVNRGDELPPLPPRLWKFR